MSERFTAIRLPGLFGSGVAERGRKSIPEMVDCLRRRAERQKADAEAILAAADTDFQITTYVGAYVERDKQILQPGRPKP